MSAAAPNRLPWSGAAAKSDKGAEPDAPVTRALRRFGRRYPAVGRAAVSVLCALASPFAMPPRGAGLAVAAAAAVIAWNLLYLWMLLPDGRSCRRYRATFAVDVTLVCALCLANPVLVDPGQQVASLGWISPIASFTVVAIQFQVGVPAAAVATLAVCTTFVAGTAGSPGLTVWDGVLAAGGGWMLVEAVLARLLWVLLQRAGREADRLMQAQFAAERVAATAAARRAAQRAHWATVHDTSASTLLMIGLGAVHGTEEWLPGQVRRDIGLLDGARDGPPDADAAEVALGPALADAACAAHVRVEVGCPAGVAAPPAVVRALAGAVAEAVENVARHAGVECARVDVQQGEGPGGLEVAVADDGAGFRPDKIGPHRFGLALSVHDRMASVGGRAVIESAPGRGTVVRLRWPA
jgi:signal transduction histidine kinase